MKYTEFDTGEHSENEGIADLMIDNSKMNTSLAETINNYVCRSFQGNIIID